MGLQLRKFFFGDYGLGRAIFYTFIFKVAIFTIGVTLMGFFLTRTALVGGANAPMFGLNQWPHIEAYTDYRDLYIKDLVVPFLKGNDAYQLGTIVYNYPPLFLYLITLFSEVNLAWFGAVPLVAFDILTVIPIFKIGKEFLFENNSKLAFAVAMIWAVNPINLFYNDLMWLNPGPTTFFMMVAIYYFLKKEWYFSAFLLAIATGLKQTAVLVAPILLVLMIKGSQPAKKILFFVLTYAGFLVLLSLPYLITEPQNYFYSLQLPILGYPPGTSAGYPTTFGYPLSEPTRLTTFLGLVSFTNLQNIAVISYQYLNYLFVFAYVTLIGYLLLSKAKPTGRSTLLFCMAALLIFFGLYGRGVYKYYFASITPFAIPFMGSRRSGIIFEAISIAILMIPRVATPWMAILLLTLLPGYLALRRQTNLLQTEGTLPSAG